MIRILAPAKVNLHLRVLAREESGFHQLETLFAALDFGDDLTLSLRGSGISLEVEGLHPCPPEENLVYRAARGFLDLAGQETGIEIRLVKRIPVQGGLGGGSSDAGATLKALATLLPGWVNDSDLLELGGRLGADVPFFLSPTPLAIAWGRGDRILALPPLPRAPVVLALPPVGVPTPEAFRLLGEREGIGGGGSSCRTPAHFASWERVGEGAQNDFEDVVFGVHPLLGRLRRALAETGPSFSLLSGSGATLFAVFEDETRAEAALNRLRVDFPETRFLLTHTLTRQPDPSPEPGVEG